MPNTGSFTLQVNLWLYIAGNTVVTRYLDNSVPETHTLAATGFVTITVAYNEPCELTADQAILVLQIVNPPADTTKGMIDV